MDQFWDKRSAVGAICHGVTGDLLRDAMLKIEESGVGYMERNEVAHKMLLNCMEHQKSMNAGTAKPSDRLPDIRLYSHTPDYVIRELDKDGWLVFKTVPPWWKVWEGPGVTVVGPQANRI